MKIKACVVISEEMLNRIVRRLDKCGCENLSNELEENHHHLEPIVKDAWNKKDTTLFDYLNDTEI